MASAAARKAASRPTMVTRFRNFLMTDDGRNLVRGLGVAVTCTGCGAYLFANTMFRSYYRDVVLHYEHGLPVKVSDKLNNFRQQVLNDMDIEKKYHRVIRLIHTVGIDPYTIGSTGLTYGADIGLPKAYAYNNVNDVEMKMIQIEQKPVLWNTDDGEQYRASLVLSDRAKKFVIAQQVAFADTDYVMVKACLFTAASMLYMAMTITANDKFYGMYKPASLRQMIYGVSAIFTYGVWSTIVTHYNKYLEQHCDDRALALGVEYAKGGVEYYSKTLQRNIAIRGLMSTRGEKTFTQFGNYKESWFRQKHIPLTVRKENAEKHVEKYITIDKSSSVVGKNDTKIVEKSDGSTTGENVHRTM